MGDDGSSSHEMQQTHNNAVLCVEWAFEGACLLTGSKDTNIKIWDAIDSQYTYMETIDGHKADVLCVKFNLASERIVSAGRDSTIKYWDASSLKPKQRSVRADDKSIKCTLLQNMDGHRGDVCTLTLTTDGGTLFSGARDNMIKVWSLVEFKELREFIGEN